MSNLVDVHIHIDYYKNHQEIYNWFDVNKIYAVFVTNLPEIYEKCITTFRPSKYIAIALGYNPQFVGKYKFNNVIFDRNLERVKYIGEVGLDFSKEYIGYKSEQLEVFDYICKKTSKENKILSVHSRNAEEDVLSILIKNKVQFAIFHWYTGEVELIDKILRAGYYFSINSSMLYNNKGKKILDAISLDRVLIETDGPFGKLDNKPSHPFYLSRAYKSFGEYFGIDDFDKAIFVNLKTLLTAHKTVQ